MVRHSLPSAEESTVLINNYCSEHHQGKLLCTLDPVKGRTLRATRGFEVGELILQEPPLHAVRLDPENHACTKLMQLCERQGFTHPAIWYWCAVNSVLVEGRDKPVDGLQAISSRQYDLLRILFIPEAVKPSTEAVTLVDFMGLRGIVEDIDMEIMIQVWLHNCFEHHQSPEGYAIYFMPSFCSHSCLPNALWCTDNDSNFRFFPRTTIRAGDEVTLTYLSEDDMLRSTAHRRQLLEGAKDFKCMCERVNETGTEELFDGALLKTAQEAAVPEVQGFMQCSRSTSESPIPDERAPDTWIQPLAQQRMYPETARGPAGQDGDRQIPVEAPTSMSLQTIWARLLLAELREGTPLGEGPSAASVGASGAAGACLTSPFFSKTSGLTSAEIASQLLQAPQSGCCCFCRTLWTNSQRQRALAVESLLEGVANSLDNPESNLRDDLHSPANSLSSTVEGSDGASHDTSNNNYDTDAGAQQLLQQLEVHELMHIMKKKWHLLDKRERRVVDSIIKLTFHTHWLVAHWCRFLESISTARRKLLHLDRLIWQYRNLYPGLTPALAWAIWDVAQAFFSLKDNSKLRKSVGFRRFADQCIVSSYNESVFILTKLFGSDGSFALSIVNNYSESVNECLERVVGQPAPIMPTITEYSGGCHGPHSLGMQLGQPIELPQVWPWYITDSLA
ncbi:Chromosome III, complete sequence, related [Eimeria maxima]|uniref:Chromosome III, complete sequence, related n=1 Tax=Eimeria maxima TaxID=5804 RepID=U6M699_EIMMA|nr:Chromosome III, complete sequence, related [Eimeria maxima]CDJ59757.1 Chromosome III, complete sequence, related [Eimeria maxima]